MDKSSKAEPVTKAGLDILVIATYLFAHKAQIEAQADAGDELAIRILYGANGVKFGPEDEPSLAEWAEEYARREGHEWPPDEGKLQEML